MNDVIKATRLEDIYKTISPEPLLTQTDINNYYIPEINQTRGINRLAHIKLGLERAHGGVHYKAFLMGHAGVGKSTELTLLARDLTDKYQTIRLSAVEALDPVSLKPFDILLLMAIEVAEHTARSVEDGGAGKKPPDPTLQRLWSWFASEKQTKTTSKLKSAGIEAGAGVTGDSLWAKASGLFASLKGEIRYASSRESKTVEYRLTRLPELIEIVNSIFDQCNKLLRENTEKEWLIIFEDFDKAGISSDLLDDLFVTYANVFRAVRSHFIFVIPIALGYSERVHQLCVGQERLFCLPDVPVFDQEHKPHTKGRDAVRKVLEARMDLTLFADDVVERLIVASGGNLRDLFSLVSIASDEAVLRDTRERIVSVQDVDVAISNLRDEYERKLGESPYEKKSIPYVDKAQKLVDIYKRKPETDVPDLILYSLLRSRAVQEFNGKRWFGVHPLVVDILLAHGKINPDSNERIPGGTEQ